MSKAVDAADYGADAVVTVAEALRSAQRAGIDRLDACLLLAHLTGRPRTWLLAHDEARLDAAQSSAWRGGLARRADGEPLAYLLGRKQFFGIDLMVDSSVLVPRPDTEALVHWAIELLQQPSAQPAPPRVLELGTGSGAIALAVKQARPDAQVVAIDASREALSVAEANGRSLGLEVDWRVGDWWAATPGERFDLVISNPPYVAEGDAHLVALRHEPVAALVSGPDGLCALRHIVATAAPHLRRDGWLILEHGFDQASAVRKLLLGASFGEVQTRRDLAGLERCSAGKRPTRPE